MARKITIGAGIALDGEKEFRQAISSINSDMKVLSSEMKLSQATFAENANSVDALRSKDELLNKQIDKQKEKVQALKQALENAKIQYSENDTRVDKWKISLNNAESELTHLNNELKTNEKYLSEAKTSTNGLAHSVDNYGKEIKEAGNRALKTGDVFKANLASQAIIGGVSALGSAIGNVATKTVDLATKTAAYADDMMTMSTQTGISTDNLQAYNYMAELTDVSLETMTKSMAKNIKSMSNAQNGSEKYVDAYKKLKVEWEDGNGKLRKSEDVYWDVIDALKGITDQTERDSISMQLFGKSAQELNPLIKIGSEGVAKFTKEAENMGAVLDEKTLNSLGATDDAIQRLTQAGDIAKRKFGAEMAPALTEAADKITAKVTDMDDSFAKFTGGALNLAVDGLGWIMDNAGLVAGGISGIAAGMAVFKAGSAIQNGMELAIDGWKKYKTVTEGATIAQYALNVAENLNPVGVLAAVLGTLTVGVVAYSVAANKASDDIDKLNEKIDNAKEATRNLKDETKRSNDEFSSNLEDVQKNNEAIQVLSDRLFNLADKENKSNIEKTQMKILVDKLNESIPNLNLVLNEQTGELNKQKPAVDALITSMKEQAVAQVYQERYLEIAKEQVTAQENLKASVDAEKEAQEGYNDALKRQQEISNEQTRDNINWDAIHKAQEDVDKYKESLKNAKKEVSSAQDELNNCNDKFSDLDNQLSTTTDNVDEFGNTVKDTSDITVEANEDSEKAIKKLTDTYKKAVKDRTKEIKDASGLFDEFALDTKVSGKKLMNNLKSQIDGMKDWSKNLKSLAKKGINEGLLAELEKMGPGAASQINALNQLSEPELKKYSNMWKEKSKLARKYAVDELSGLKEDTDMKIDELTKSTETKLYNSGKNSMQGYINGFKVNVPELNAYAVDTFGGLVNGINTKLGIHSPSTVFKKIAHHSIEGFVLGIKESKSMAGKSMSEISDEILSKAQQHLDNYKVYHKVSTNEEVAYWDAIRKECKKGTQARVDADKNYFDALKDVKEKIKSNNEEILSDAKTRLENNKVYHTMSIEDEVKYWNNIRKEIKKGTQARIDADKEYFDVKKSQNEAEKELLEKQTEAEKTYKDNCKKIQDDLVTNIEEANKKYNDAVESRTNSIISSLGLFDKFTANQDVSGQQLLDNLRGQVTGMTEWSNNLNKLKSRGISDGLLEELEDMGVKSSGEVAALNSLTDEQLNQYVSLWQNKTALAKSEAVEELSGLKEETSKKIEELNVQANKDLKSYYKEYKSAMKEIGAAIKEPIVQVKVTIGEEGTAIVENLTNAMKKAVVSSSTTSKLKFISQSLLSPFNLQIQSGLLGANISKGIGISVADSISGISNEMANSTSELSNYSQNSSYNMNEASNISNSSIADNFNYNKLANCLVSAFNSYKPQVILDNEKFGDFILDSVNKEVFA